MTSVFLALLLAGAQAEPPTAMNEMEAKADPALTQMPADVRDFVVRYNNCQHWQGEDAYDAERGREIASAVADVCTGNTRRLAALRRAHASRAAVTELLAIYEDQD